MDLDFFGGVIRGCGLIGWTGGLTGDVGGLGENDAGNGHGSGVDDAIDTGRVFGLSAGVFWFVG